MKIAGRERFPSPLEGRRFEFVARLEKLSNKIIDTCQAKSKTFEEFRQCTKPRLDRLNMSTVELNAAAYYVDKQYEKCIEDKQPKEECKQTGFENFSEYFKEFLSRVRKNEPDPEPFIDYDAFNELADEEAEEDEAEAEGGDDEDEDDDEEDDD